MRHFIFVIPLLLASIFAHAEQALTLQQVLNSVETHYPLVRAASQGLTKSQGELKSAQGGFDPTLKTYYEPTLAGEYENKVFDAKLEQPTALWGTKLFAGYRHGQGKFGPYDEKLLTNDNGEIRGGLEIPLLRDGWIDDRRANIRIKEKEVEASEARLKQQLLESKRQASHRYFDWVSAAEKLKVAQTLYNLARERDDAMHVRVQKGDAARVEQLDNQRSLLHRDALLVQAKREFDQKSQELSIFYRDEKGSPKIPNLEVSPQTGLELPKASPLPIQDLQMGSEKLQSVFRLHPELKRLEAGIAQIETERELAGNTLLPKLNFELATSKDWGAGSPGKAITEYSAAIRLEFPILFRGARGKIQSTTAEQLRMEALAGLSRDRIRVDLENTNLALTASIKRIEMSQQEYQLAQKVESAERTKFKQGDSNILIVNLREQATADAKIRAIDALAEFYRANADLEVNSGGIIQAL